MKNKTNDPTLKKKKKTNSNREKMNFKDYKFSYEISSL